MAGQILDLRAKATHDFIPVTGDVPAFRRVIAEYPQQRRFEKLGRFHRDLEPLEMLLPRLIDLYLSNRRADADHPHAVGLKLASNLVSHGRVKVEYVLLRHRAQLEVCDR